MVKPLCWMLLLASCNEQTAQLMPRGDSLGEGVVARVGALDIRDQEVVRVSARQGTGPTRCLQSLVEDALWAQRANQTGLASSWRVKQLQRAFFARRVLEEVRAETSGTPPTDEEVAEATERHFTELDRPDAYRVLHSVVKLRPKSSDQDRERAHELAETLAKSLKSSHDADEFRKRAGEFDGKGLEIVTEDLKPVTGDGRVLEPDRTAAASHYDERFAAAAAKIAEIGGVVGPVESSFGWHVLMLLEHVESRRTPLEERRAILREEILAGRARSSLGTLRTRLRSATSPQVDGGAATLLASVALSSL